jgi:hypothetical protein
VRRVREGFVEFWDDYSWVVIGLLWVLVMISGFVGFHNYLQPKENWTPTVLDVIYRTLQLIVLESGSIEGNIGLPLEFARFVAPPLAALTALKAFTTIFRDKLRLIWLKWFCKDHTIVCGLGRKGFQFVAGLLAQRLPVVVIEKDDSNEFIRKCKEQRAIVLIGDARDRGMLEKARLENAQTLVCSCGQDETNAEIALRARTLSANRKENSVLCLVHIFSPYVCDLLRPLKHQAVAPTALRLEWFSIFQNGAWAMLNRYPPFRDDSLEADSRPHILVVGLGWLGQSVVVQAAKKWRPYRSMLQKRLIVTTIDREAQRNTGYLCSKHRGLDDECEFRPLDIDVQSNEFQDAAFVSDHLDGYTVNSIYVCLDNPDLALEATLSLAMRTTDQAIPIVTRVDYEEGIADLLKAAGQGSPVHQYLAPFVLFKETCRPDIYIQLDGDRFTTSYHGSVMIERLARHFHRDYVRGQLLSGKKLGQTAALVDWEMLPENYREENRKQARELHQMILQPAGFGVTPMIGWETEPYSFSTEQIEELACREHERWRANKMAEGYSYGHSRDEALMLHPKLLQWSELDEETKEQNRNWVRRLPDLLTDIDYEIYKLPQDIRFPYPCARSVGLD